MFSRLRLSVLTLLVLFGFLMATYSFAQPFRTLTPEDVVRFKIVSQVTLSPDGEQIAYVLRVPREEGDKPGSAYSEIWMVDRQGKNPRRFTLEKVNSWAPQWSPEGTKLTFLSRREEDEATQVYEISTAGGEGYPLTKAKTSIQKYQWSPDGNWIAYLARDPESPEAKEAKRRGEDWEIVERDFRHMRIWLYNVQSKEEHLLTSGDYTVWDFTWTPDSRTLIMAASDKPFTDYSYMYKKIYSINIEDGKARLLHDPGAKLGIMKVSPDGGKLAFLAGVDIYDPTSGTVFLLNLFTNKVTNLSGEFEGTFRWLDWWDEDDLVAVVEEGVYTNVLLWNVRANDYKRLVEKGPIFRSMNIVPEKKLMAFAGSTPRHPSEVFLAGIDGRHRRLTDSNPWLKEVRLADQEPIQWKARDGWTIQGILLKPLNFTEGKKYPLILQIHGGPEYAYLNGWTTYYSRWSQLLAARGYMVLMPNYRGSTGRGRKYAEADHLDLGGKEFLDVLDGIRFLAQEKGWIDSTKVGIGGGSYGGYFSAWAATKHSQHFAASVVFAGVTNWISFTGTTDIPREMSLVHWAMFWLDNEAYEKLAWDRSPLAHIRDARTPTLIAHGQKDLRVPLGQGRELYRALEMRNIPVEMVIYPREPHGLRERRHQLDYIHRVLNWYDKYIKGVTSK